MAKNEHGWTRDKHDELAREGRREMIEIPVKGKFTTSIRPGSEIPIVSKLEDAAAERDTAAVGSADDYTGESIDDYRAQLAAATRWREEALEKGWIQLAELLWQDMQVLEDRLHALGDPDHPHGGLHMQRINDD